MLRAYVTGPFRTAPVRKRPSPAREPLPHGRGSERTLSFSNTLSGIEPWAYVLEQSLVYARRRRDVRQVFGRVEREIERRPRNAA